MIKTKAFNNEIYLKEEKKLVLERASKFHKLYLEIGGHLLYDGHASRVLPGYNPKNKLNLIKSFGKKVGVVYCVNAIELEKNRNWGNSKEKLSKTALQEIKKLSKQLDIIGVAITFFSGQKLALDFIEKVEKIGFETIVTTFIKGYPDFRSAFSQFGFIDQPKLTTNKKIIVVTGAGANNGKMFFCLTQIYHLGKEKKDAGYAKIETFPIWNLPLDHEVNLAYEAATADIKDYLEIDPFHKKKYKKNAVNYNRDINAFPILKKIITKLTSKKNYMQKYNSPTNMGLNAAKIGIIDDTKVREAGLKEIKSRLNKFKQSKNKQAIGRIQKIIKELNE
ncbi:MAG: DUF1846 family protein [Candidatus Diapherotrites archaeon]|jgi:uncharacterized protein (UPF0371 family)|uniref:DUF1846 family protein n=1 Tax=Candidatus Iainarchaeum sp. TaxID=3101447 RepID=A0A8T5GED7_9ARCH|nr:DUF1846 family protein [Candidatus Diapherotrites archaeon]MBT7241370.1 DUF1846 family protein [Candidatus Diapherotrites archaeon]